MNKDELLNKICDLITDATVDPSGESIMATTKEIMNLIDEYEHSDIQASS
jgi:Mn-dependent DtxR family transcriptional regulator